VVGFEIVPYTHDGERLLTVGDFFLGFGNEALITICTLMMVGKALETTGALQPLANVVGRAWAARPVLALLVTLIAGAVLIILSLIVANLQPQKRERNFEKPAAAHR